MFTDSLAIKEDPCTVSAGPIVDTDTMPRLTPAERERAVGLLTAGEYPRAVAVAFNVHLATIYRLQQRFTASGVTDDRPRTGDDTEARPPYLPPSRKGPVPDSQRDWQEHPRESPETYQRPDGAATVGEPASSSSTGPYSKTSSCTPAVGQKPRQLELEAMADHSVY